MEGVNRLPKWEVGDWVFAYDTKGTNMSLGNLTREGAVATLSSKLSNSR